MQQWESAAECFDKISKPGAINMNAADVACELEECYASLGDTSSAEECRKTALKFQPLLTVNIAKAAWFMYNATLDSSEPIFNLKKCVEREDENPKIWYYLGRVMLDEKLFDASEEALLNACERDESSSQTWVALGELYSNRGRDDFAIKAFLRATELKPDETSTWELLAHTYEKFGGPARAVEIYTMIEEMDGDADFEEEKDLLREIAATMIQRVFRGYTVRNWVWKGWRHRTRQRAVARMVAGKRDRLAIPEHIIMQGMRSGMQRESHAASYRTVFPVVH